MDFDPASEEATQDAPSAPWAADEAPAETETVYALEIDHEPEELLGVQFTDPETGAQVDLHPGDRHETTSLRFARTLEAHSFLKLVDA